MLYVVVVSTVVGTGTQGNTDGTGSTSSLYYPSACTFYQQDMYILVTTDVNIRKIEYSTWTVSTLAGGTGYSGAANGVGTNAGFHTIRGIAVTSDNSVAFVSDALNYCIRMIIISTATVSNFAGSGAYGGANGVGTNAQFDNPFGLAIYPIDGSFMLVTNRIGQTVVKLEISNAEVSSFAGVYYSTTSGDGTGSGATFDGPAGISFHPTGSYAVFSEQYAFKIRKITYPGAVVSTLAGSTTSGSSDGTGVAASFNNLYGLTIDVYGNYALAADKGNNKIRKITLSNALVTLFVGTGTSGSADGSDTTATFYYPYDVCFSKYDNAAVVTDTYNAKLRLIQGFEPTPTPTSNAPSSRVPSSSVPSAVPSSSVPSSSVPSSSVPSAVPSSSVPSSSVPSSSVPSAVPSGSIPSSSVPSSSVPSAVPSSSVPSSSVPSSKNILMSYFNLEC